MEFEPQCKTKSQVHREWARVLEMCEGTNVAPISCYKKLIEPNFNIFDVGFNSAPACYEFAIAIVEGKPVFRGDELYDSAGIKYVAGYAKEQEQIWAKPDTPMLYGTSKSGKAYFCQLENAISFSWNPPKPKTFTLENIPAPSTCWHTERCANEFSIHFAFNTPEEATAMEKIVLGQLSKQM